MNNKKNDNGLFRKQLRDALETKTPDEWVNLLNKLIKDDLTRYWTASTMLYSWRGGEAYGTALDYLASNYQAATNSQGDLEKNAAYEILGLPIVRCASDNAKPSIMKKRSITMI